MNAMKLFELLKESGLVGATGETYFELHGIKTLVRDSSVVGSIIQEWLKSFMQKHNIEFRVPDNSQEFPDYYMDATSNVTDLLEVKCFKKSPNFDIANFIAYCRSLATKPYRLDANYLIFEYAETDTGIVIKNIWLKKVWEITCSSERAALKIQWKQNVAVNIRPATWYAKNPEFKPFETRKAFVKALKTVLDTNAAGGDWRNNWYQTVTDTYKSQTTQDL